MKKLIGISLFLFIASVAFSYTPTEGIRLNQVGYINKDHKIAMVLTSKSLIGTTFQVKCGNSVVFSGTVTADKGTYGGFSHLYLLDFTSFTNDGTYTVKIDGFTSTSFKIDSGKSLYVPLFNNTIYFLNYQRCGDPVWDQWSDHQQDAVVRTLNKKISNTVQDLSGGWHDATDDPKMMQTEAPATMHMMLAYDRFDDSIFTSVKADLIREIQWSLAWIYKMWDPQNQIMYGEIGTGDGSDFENRIAYAVDLQPGSGANIAGKIASCLAKGYALKLYPNSTVGAQWLSSAKSAYVYGQKHPLTFQDLYFGYYTELEYFLDANGDPMPTRGWQDDMALAAIELYNATQDYDYLEDAKTYIKAANAYSTNMALDWRDCTGMADYEIARVDKCFITTASNYFTAKFDGPRYARDKFGACEKDIGYVWGTTEDLANRICELNYFQDLTGVTKYYKMSSEQRDYIFGRNPYNICFVDSAGTINAEHEYSDVRTNCNKLGWWAEGPSKLDFFVNYTNDGEIAPITSSSFDTPNCFYLDRIDNFINNEETIGANAVGFEVEAWQTIH